MEARVATSLEVVRPSRKDREVVCSATAAACILTTKECTIMEVQHKKLLVPQTHRMKLMLTASLLIL